MRRALIQAANGAVKKNKSFYQSKYNKLTFRLGSRNKAKVAIANRLARAIYKVLGGEDYKELGYSRANSNEAKAKNLLNQLKNLGLKVRYVGNEVVVSESMKVRPSGVSLA